MRILHLVPNFHPFVGGVERIVQELTIFQVKNRMDPIVVFPDRLGKFANEYEVTGVRVIPFHFPKLVLPWFMIGIPLKGKYATAEVAKIFADCRNLIQKEKPQIIHIHAASEISLPVINIARSIGIPVIFHAHQEYLSDSFKPGDQRMLSQASHIIAVSKAVEKSIVNRTQESTRVKTIYNGIEIREFPNKDASTYKRNIVIAGRFSVEKGFDLGIRAFSKVLESKADCDLFVIGNGPEKANLEILVRDLGIQDKVFFKGVLSKDELLYACHNATCVLIPTPSSESFSMLAVEAMSAGTPVIATNVGGLPEVVQNGVTGYLVEPSPEEISKALLHLFQDEMSIREFGQNAKIIAKKNFSVQRFGQEITNEYTFALRETRE